MYSCKRVFCIAAKESLYSRKRVLCTAAKESDISVQAAYTPTNAHLQNEHTHAHTHTHTPPTVEQATTLSTQKPLIYTQNSLTTPQKRPICFKIYDCKTQNTHTYTLALPYFRRPAGEKDSTICHRAPNISIKEPYIHPQKRPMNIHKNGL